MHNKEGWNAGITNMTVREEDVHDRDSVRQGHVSAFPFTPFAVARESFAGQLCLPTAVTHGRFASSLCLCLCLCPTNFHMRVAGRVPQIEPVLYTLNSACARGHSATWRSAAPTVPAGASACRLEKTTAPSQAGSSITHLLAAC